MLLTPARSLGREQRQVVSTISRAESAAGPLSSGVPSGTAISIGRPWALANASAMRIPAGLDQHLLV
jgi:hypothetical protein